VTSDLISDSAAALSLLQQQPYLKNGLVCCAAC
jgi:hypothetical protein